MSHKETIRINVKNLGFTCDLYYATLMLPERYVLKNFFSSMCGVHSQNGKSGIDRHIRRRKVCNNQYITFCIK